MYRHFSIFGLAPSAFRSDTSTTRLRYAPHAVRGNVAHGVCDVLAKVASCLRQAEALGYSACPHPENGRVTPH